MNKIADEAYEYKGTQFHLRAFVDSFGIEKPVFVVEEAAQNKNSLLMNRVEIAKDLSGSLGRTPEQVTWLELSPNGSLKQVDFQYTHTDTIYPKPANSSDEEIQAGEKGEINTDTITRYNANEREASRPDFQAQVGDALETYEKRQNQDFERMKGLDDKATYRQEREAELARNPLYEYAPDL